MNTEKRLLLFLGLSLGALLFFNRFNQPAQKVQPPLAAEKYKSAEPTPSAAPIPPNTLSPKELSLKTESLTFKDFTITVSLTGGFIKDININKYGETLLYKNLFFLPAYADKEFRLEKVENGIRLSWDSLSGKVVKEIRFISPYLLSFEVTAPGKIDKLILLQSEKDKKSFYSRYQEVFYKAEKMKRIGWSKVKTTLSFVNPELIGTRDRYYAAAFLSPLPGQYSWERQDRQAIDLVFYPEKPFSPISGRLFLGPQDIKILKPLGIQEVIYFGVFNGIGFIILNLLHFFFGWFHNWGVSILILSTLIYWILSPLTISSTKSMKKMQELQPEIEALRKKLKDTPQKLNKEVLELYRKYKVNPLGGCLPMLLQIPIFFALYQVLIRSVEIKGAHFLWIKDLAKPDYIVRFAAPLPILKIDGIHILPILMAVIMFLQQKMTAPQGQSSEQQKMMAMIFPVVFGFIFYNFSAGLVLYWFCNSLFTFLYQLRLAKH